MKLIWSYEHRAWWKGGACGYTIKLSEAGFYQDDMAKRIVADANIVPGSRNEEAVEPAEINIEMARWMQVRHEIPLLIDAAITSFELVLELFEADGKDPKNIVAMLERARYLKESLVMGLVNPFPS